MSSGNNITNYDYRSSNESDENLEFRSGSGTNFEVGYLHSFNNYKLLYSIGFVYNEFSAEASGAGSNYSWKTRYMGIINKFSYNLSNCCFNTGFNTFLTLGFSTSERNRPDTLGGAEASGFDLEGQQDGDSDPDRSEALQNALATMMPAEVIGDMVLHAIQKDEFYILSHTEFKEGVAARGQAISDSFDFWANYRRDHNV